MKPLLAFILLTFFVTASAQKGQFICKWNNPGGNPALTTQDYHSYEKGKMLVYLSNDDSSVYLDMKIPETKDQNQILKSGLTVWICPDGKHHRVNGIRFPTGTRRSGFHGRGPGQNDINLSPLSQANKIELVGFANIEPKTFPSDNKENIRGAVWYDKIGDLFYRLTIPFSKFPAAYQSGMKPDDHLTFGIEYTDQSGVQNRGEFQSPGGMRESMSGSGGSRGGGGGSRGGGGGGGRGGMRGGSSFARGPGAGSYSHESTVLVWVKDIKLATH